MLKPFACALLLAALLGSTPRSRDVVPLTNAHAHNDYNHRRPLFDAMDCGFCSIEADVAIANGIICVTHDRKSADPSRSLERLYLQPLEKRIVDHGDRVYRDGPTVILLIDCKSPPEQLYAALRDLLMKHKTMLTTWENGQRHERAITVVLTGNHPPPSTFTDEKIRSVAIDGTFKDVDSEVSPELMPQLAIEWRSQLKWNGYGTPTDQDRKTLADLVSKAHAHGRTLRLWGAPDLPRVWTEELNAGVDYINTDDLRGFADFAAAARATSQPYTHKTPADSPPDPENK